MAKSMLKRRQEAARERNEYFDRTLRHAARPERHAPDFEGAIKEARRGLPALAIRHGDEWRPQLKTRDAGRLLLAAARHLYARYPTPAHLEAIWTDQPDLGAPEVKLRRRWYAVAAGGGSLFKAELADMMSRKEVHWFLNPQGNLTFEQAFVAAIARTYTANIGVAMRIARSTISQKPRADIAFWRDVVRFFAVNTTTLEEIDDLCDYIDAARQHERSYSLKGRTLVSLRRAMRQWHRDLEAIARIQRALQMIERERARAAGQTWRPQASSSGRWPGSKLMNWSWEPSDKLAKKRREEYRFVQLNTADQLVEESSAMRHCVSSYAARCISGACSIWSLRRSTKGKVERLLTIELDRQNTAVQIRGFGNRLANAEERQVLGRWATARNITLLA